LNKGQGIFVFIYSDYNIQWFNGSNNVFSNFKMDVNYQISTSLYFIITNSSHSLYLQ